MKTLKIKPGTHRRLAIYKAIKGCKSMDELIEDLITTAREYDYEYSNINIDQYEQLSKINQYKLNNEEVKNGHK